MTTTPLRPSQKDWFAIALAAALSITAVMGARPVLGAEDADGGTADVEAAARRLESELMAPCCWNQPLSSHRSPAAEDMKAEIRKLLSEGTTPEEVLDRYVDLHGLRILSKPPPTGFQRLLYLLPPAFLLFSAFLLITYGRRLANRGRRGAQGEDQGVPPPKTGESPDREDGLRAKLKEELERLD